MAVDVKTAPAFVAGKPRLLFTGKYRLAFPVRGYRGYDVTRLPRIS
jgi:hypothetical protein